MAGQVGEAEGPVEELTGPGGFLGKTLPQSSPAGACLDISLQSGCVW